MKRATSFFLIVLIISLCISHSIPATAQPLLQSFEQNQRNAASYALSFAKTFTKNSDLSTGEVITMLNADNKVAGFCVDILIDQTNHGYVIIKFANNEPVISEFCLESGALNPYMTMISHYGLTKSNLTFYSIGSNNYQIYDKTNKCAKDYYGRDFSANEFSSYLDSALFYSSRNTSDVDSLNYSSLDGWSVVSDTYDGTINASRTITGADNITYYDETTVSNNNRTYACSVVAVSNLMKYYYSIGYTNLSSSFTVLYDAIWNYAGTNSSGTTPNGNEPIAARSYLLSKGYGCSYTSFTAYSTFKTNLALNKPCLFTYGAQFGNINGGHAVFVVGYVDTSSYQYLKIADGWNSYLRYINYDGYNYSRKNGWAINAS